MVIHGLDIDRAKRTMIRTHTVLEGTKVPVIEELNETRGTRMSWEANGYERSVSIYNEKGSNFVEINVWRDSNGTRSWYHEEIDGPEKGNYGSLVQAVGRAHSIQGDEVDREDELSSIYP